MFSSTLPCNFRVCWVCICIKRERVEHRGKRGRSKTRWGRVKGRNERWRIARGEGSLSAFLFSRSRSLCDRLSWKMFESFWAKLRDFVRSGQWSKPSWSFGTNSLKSTHTHTGGGGVDRTAATVFCFHPRPPLGLLSLPVCRRVQGCRWLFFCILADSCEYKWLYVNSVHSKSQIRARPPQSAGNLERPAV
jgi:hypothetical protein